MWIFRLIVLMGVYLEFFIVRVLGRIITDIRNFIYGVVVKRFWFKSSFSLFEIKFLFIWFGKIFFLMDICFFNSDKF